MPAFQAPPTPPPAAHQPGTLVTKEQLFANGQVPQPQQPSLGNQMIRDVLYSLQAADAKQSGALLSRPGTFETNPLMKPFSHGGPATYAIGFALGDALRNLLLRHASQGTKNTADILQGVSNLQGLLQTAADQKRLGPQPLPKPTGTP